MVYREAAQPPSKSRSPSHFFHRPHRKNLCVSSVSLWSAMLGHEIDTSATGPEVVVLTKGAGVAVLPGVRYPGWSW